MTAADVIPEMTHPLSKHWDQPARKHIIFDRDGHALVDKRTFNALPEYSTTIPTGVYEGKMWKRHDGICDKFGYPQPEKAKWMLGWYGPSKDPDKCSVNFRLMILSESEVSDANR